MTITSITVGCSSTIASSWSLVVGRQFLLVVESPVGALALDLRLKARG
jgi:hypothetical protein